MFTIDMKKGHIPRRFGHEAVKNHWLPVCPMFNFILTILLDFRPELQSSEKPMSLPLQSPTTTNYQEQKSTPRKGGAKSRRNEKQKERAQGGLVKRAKESI